MPKSESPVFSDRLTESRISTFSRPRGISRFYRAPPPRAHPQRRRETASTAPPCAAFAQLFVLAGAGNAPMVAEAASRNPSRAFLSSGSPGLQARCMIQPTGATSGASGSFQRTAQPAATTQVPAILCVDERQLFEATSADGSIWRMRSTGGGFRRFLHLVEDGHDRRGRRAGCQWRASALPGGASSRPAAPRRQACLQLRRSAAMAIREASGIAACRRWSRRLAPRIVSGTSFRMRSQLRIDAAARAGRLVLDRSSAAGR